MIRYRSTCGIVCQFVMYIFIFLSSCTQRVEKVENLSKYYLPLDELEGGGLVYSFRSLVDTTLDREVWQYIKTSEGLITSINYDHRQQVVQRQYERVVSNGVVIDSLILVDYDSLGRAISHPVRVISPHRFPFEVQDSTQVWLTHLEWWQPGDGLHIVLQRRRRFAGETVWEWQGKTIPAVRFNTEDKLETEKDGWTTSAWSGEEVYAANIGLIYYKRKISEQLVIEFELDDIRPGEKRD